VDAKIITETARATLEGTIPFPDVVQRLLATGVEYYNVNRNQLEKLKAVPHHTSAQS
jgi:hypothetical protein